MQLTKDNIQEWKNELNKIMVDFVPQGHKYSDCNRDEEWISTYEGFTPEEAKEDEIYYSSQN